jgi:DNA primase
VAGRFSDADKERVRDASRIEAVIGDYVALRPAGSGNLKGLCPFHEEKSPSFHVRPTHGTYHCFGCGEGGDVFSFVAAIDHLTFVEAVQRLADRAGITLTMVDGGGPGRAEAGNRSRLLAANRAAAAFYAGQLTTDEAAPAREFLAQRGFDMAAATAFGCGFAPSGWDRLIKALTSQGFSVRELTEAGLARSGQRGPIDQFHRRLLWPIRDGAGDVVGFGARRLFDDDRLEAKYINTAETRVYHKSQVLFGLDLAKREIAKQRRAVVVEGYTDVMAMHLAGVTTAVASCGTAFGDEHVSVLRRYLQDNEVMRGEVIYTFDGDAAGQKAALKAFDADQRFAANTSVAIAPDGMDPCELRLESGDVALRELVEGRKPLFAFAIRSTLDGYDLDTAEGQVAATAAAIPLVARIKEVTLRVEYARRLAGWLGVEPGPIVSRVRQSAGRSTAQDNRSGRDPSSGGPPGRGRPEPAAADRRDRDQPEADAAAAGPTRPNPADRRSSVEREMVKLVLQQPDLVASGYAQVQAVAFTDPAYLAVHEAVLRAGGPEETGGGAAWVTAVAAQAPAGPVRSLVTELAVEPPRHRSDEPDGRYAGAIVARMAERAAAVEERRLQSALRRAEAEHDRDRAMSLQTDLVKMAAYRRALSDRARGEMV